jgi:hypothetical protein
MSSTAYAVRQYISFTADEFLGLSVTSLFIAFIVSARDLLFERWGEALAVQRFLLTFVFLLLILLATVWFCKAIAIRLGYTINYKSHHTGLVFGGLVAVASAGFLPIFLPGGFDYHQPERLAVGKWRGYRKGWEVALIAAAFPLFLLAWILLLSPIYLLSQGEFYAHIMEAVILIALFACIPMVFIRPHHGGRAYDWFRYLGGTTFGLDVFFASPAWWAALCAAVVVFGMYTYLLTTLATPVTIFVYIASLFTGGMIVWIYNMFFRQ